MMSPMRVRHQMHYPAPPDEVFEMLADPEFREAVCIEIDSTGVRVEIDRVGNSMNVLVVHRQDTDDIPTFAKKMVGDEILIEQHETWQTPTSAELEISIPGKPGHLRGTIVLEQDGDGTVETLDGELRVNVPLIGGQDREPRRRAHDLRHGGRGARRPPQTGIDQGSAADAQEHPLGAAEAHRRCQEAGIDSLVGEKFALRTSDPEQVKDAADERPGTRTPSAEASSWRWGRAVGVTQGQP